MIGKYVYDQQVMKEEFTEILKMMDKYYVVKYELREKNQLAGNIEKIKNGTQNKVKS